MSGNQAALFFNNFFNSEADLLKKINQGQERLGSDQKNRAHTTDLVKCKPRLQIESLWESFIRMYNGETFLA